MELERTGEKIKKLMTQKNISTKELAKKINIKTSELKQRLDGKKEFLASEAAKVANIFELTIQEFADIFFDSKILPKEEKQEIIRK